MLVKEFWYGLLVMLVLGLTALLALSCRIG